MNTALDASANGNTFNYNRAGAQNVIGTTYDDININVSGTKTSIGSLDINGHLTITGTAQLNVESGNDNINLAGNWTATSSNADPFVEGTDNEIVTFDGGSNQVITNLLGAESFNNLTVSKSAGLLSPSNTNIDIEGILSLISGNIRLGTDNMIIGNAGSITNGSSASYIITNNTGSLTQTNVGGAGRTGDIIFPVGKSGEYTPITINNDAGTADNFIVRVCQDVYEEATCESGTVVNSDVVDRTWFISESIAGGSDATVTFQWNTANETSGFDRTNLLFKHHNGSIWETIGAGSAVAVGGGTYEASVANVNDFSPFAVEDGDSPLPVELVSFDARNINNEVEVEWVTASEINNDYFILERSVDSKSFEELAIITGNGTTNETITYNFTDARPYGGISYYRITQVDYDGTSKTYAPVKVNISLSGEVVSYVHPVPSNGDFINIQLSGFDKSLGAQIKIVSVKGETVYAEDIFLDENNGFNQKIEFSKRLPAGIYILNISTPEPIIKRIMVK
ncbi:MAG: T9SS type A sorting domain-containing protein [Fulvivirga sp.]